MQTQENMPRPEILSVADIVAREKNIDKEDVLEAMEVAIQKSARSKYGAEHDIRAHIDRKTGAISLARYREVVAREEDVENESVQMTLDEAQAYNPDVKVGEFIIDALPPIDFGRIAAQTAKQVIVQKVREAERNKQFEEYKEKIGTIVNGTVKRVEFGNITLDIGKTEAVLRRDETIPREKFKVGDRVRAYVLDVRRENKGPQIFLSRTCPEFLAKLFMQEVPEIYDGIVKIMGVARDPGSKAKIAVKDTPYEILTEKLTGPIALAFGFNDPVSPAKAVSKFIKDTKKGVIIGAALDGKLLSESETKALAELPSKEELYAKMLGCVNSPATGIVGSINAVMAQLTRAMAAVRDQKAA